MTDADYTSGPVDGVTIDGQQLLLTFNVRYRVDATRVSDIYENIGKTPGEINERVVKFHTRSISRQIANTKRADELYLGNLATISAEMRDAIAPRFTEAGLILEFFELKRPNFSDAYETAIESRQIAEVQIEQRRQEALVAEQEAERVRNEAQGQADANVIRAEGEAQALRDDGPGGTREPRDSGTGADPGPDECERRLCAQQRHPAYPRSWGGGSADSHARAHPDVGRAAGAAGDADAGGVGGLGGCGSERGRGIPWRPGRGAGRQGRRLFPSHYRAATGIPGCSNWVR